MFQTRPLSVCFLFRTSGNHSESHSQADSTIPNRTNQPELEGKEGDAGALVELGLELHPVKPEGVQERRQTLHQY